MKYTSSLEQLSVDMFRSSFYELDKNLLDTFLSTIPDYASLEDLLFHTPFPL